MAIWLILKVKMSLSSYNKLFFLLLSLFFCCSCATSKKLSPISKAFLEDVDTSKKIKQLPFDHAWAWKKVPRGTYSSVFISPITLKYLPESAWKDSEGSLIDSREKFDLETKLISQYFYNSVNQQLGKLENLDFQIAKKCGPNTVKIEIALTELQFSRPAVHATGLLPVPGLGLATSEINYPHAAFALRITDCTSGELIATIADRKFPPIRLIDLNKLTVTSSIREICENWAIMLAETMHKGHLQSVDESGTISISLW